MQIFATILVVYEYFFVHSNEKEQMFVCWGSSWFVNKTKKQPLGIFNWNHFLIKWHMCMICITDNEKSLFITRRSHSVFKSQKV